MIKTQPTSVQMRAMLFCALMWIVDGVMDGLPKVFEPGPMQLITLPLTLCFGALMLIFFFRPEMAARWWPQKSADSPRWSWRSSLKVAIVLECIACVVFVREGSYYAAFGYQLHVFPTVVIFGATLLGLVAMLRMPARPLLLLVVALGGYAATYALSIHSFPVTILRSDMLPVIQAAEKFMFAGETPYRLLVFPTENSFFPYLPGTLFAFAPSSYLHFDPRYTNIAAMVIAMALVYWATAKEYRQDIAALIAVFVLGPFPQYRHDIYTAPQWLSLAVILILLYKRRTYWAGVAFGVSIILTQFSWVIFPFYMLYAMRKGGVWGTVKATAVSFATAAALIWWPAKHWGLHTIFFGSVTNFDVIKTPASRPMNFSYWLAYLVPTNDFKWVQLVVLACIFFYCFFRQQCRTAADTVRWMTLALLIFILLNPLVDGYFFLMLGMVLLCAVAMRNGWWSGGEPLPATAQP